MMNQPLTDVLPAKYCSGRHRTLDNVVIKSRFICRRGSPGDQITAHLEISCSGKVNYRADVSRILQTVGIVHKLYLCYLDRIKSGILELLPGGLLVLDRTTEVGLGELSLLLGQCQSISRTLCFPNVINLTRG